jgi:hypothetical protein
MVGGGVATTTALAGDGLGDGEAGDAMGDGDAVGTTALTTGAGVGGAAAGAQALRHAASETNSVRQAILRLVHFEAPS